MPTRLKKKHDARPCMRTSTVLEEARVSSTGPVGTSSLPKGADSMTAAPGTRRKSRETAIEGSRKVLEEAEEKQGFVDLFCRCCRCAGEVRFC